MGSSKSKTNIELNFKRYIFELSSSSPLQLNKAHEQHPLSTVANEAVIFSVKICQIIVHFMSKGFYLSDFHIWNKSWCHLPIRYQMDPNAFGRSLICCKFEKVKGPRTDPWGPEQFPRDLKDDWRLNRNKPFELGGEMLQNISSLSAANIAIFVRNSIKWCRSITLLH